MNVNELLDQLRHTFHNEYVILSIMKEIKVPHSKN